MREFGLGLTVVLIVVLRFASEAHIWFTTLRRPRRNCSRYVFLFLSFCSFQYKHSMGR